MNDLTDKHSRTLHDLEKEYIQEVWSYNDMLHHLKKYFNKTHKEAAALIESWED